MRTLTAVAITVVAAAALAVAAAFAVVALLDAPPEQPNTPLISYDTSPTGR
ncbi:MULTISPECIES: hypothetical protein [Streptomyces]|uniref:SPW_0924 family protein n=1 Tax=Streptomyces lichenis TaxID=2306967 RepID=A0ABT0IAJ9_9ACTN|nr:hypothetical protein [Streptomyces lichenis]MCK8678351.1 hypothetical protein [Streptomyces lichenis]